MFPLLALQHFPQNRRSAFEGKDHELFKAIDKDKAYIREEADRHLKNLDTSNPQNYFEIFLVKTLEGKQ